MVRGLLRARATVRLCFAEGDSRNVAWLGCRKIGSEEGLPLLHPSFQRQGGQDASQETWQIGLWQPSQMLATIGFGFRVAADSIWTIMESVSIGVSESTPYRDCIINWTSINNRTSISDFRPGTCAAKPLWGNSVNEFGVPYGTARAIRNSASDSGNAGPGSEGERRSVRLPGAWSCVGLFGGKASLHSERPRSWTCVTTHPFPVLPPRACPSSVWVVHLQLALYCFLPVFWHCTRLSPFKDVDGHVIGRRAVVCRKTGAATWTRNHWAASEHWEAKSNSSWAEARAKAAKLFHLSAKSCVGSR